LGNEREDGHVFGSLPLAYDIGFELEQARARIRPGPSQLEGNPFVRLKPVKKRRLLLAADDTATRERLASVLAGEDLVILRSSSLQEDLAAFAKEAAPDAIVLAGSTSELSQAAYRRLRRDAELAKVALVVNAPPPDGAASAASSSSSRDTFAGAGAGDADLRWLALAALARRRKILVADDEPLLRRMYESYLKNEGYDVVSAADGDEAIETAKADPPDLVITDVKMPRADGYEVCRALKEDKDTRHVPVVIVSALGGEIDVNRGFTSGANDYLTKPIDLEDLRERIDAIFRGIETRGRETILIVVTDSVERSALEFGLSQQGFEAIGAGDAEEGLVLARELAPSVVVVDAVLPHLDVGGFRRRLLEHPRTREASMVVLAGKGLRFSREQKRALGATAYVQKPYTIDRLVMTIEKILGEVRVKNASELEMVLQMVASLANALEAKDVYTRGHSDKVAKYSRLIAKTMQLPDDRIYEIHLAAQLHDIGKIGIRDSVLLKPDKLDELEFKIIQEHPTIGADIMQPIARLRNIVPMVRHHHERWDGKGYPHKIGANEIPLGARIIAVADTYDSCIANRPYRRGMEPARALAILEECAGSQLDREVVKAMLSLEAVLKSPFALRELTEAEAHDALHHAGPGGHVHDSEGFAFDGHRHAHRHSHPHPHPHPDPGRP
jgi:response regulator RpfG family c-di-GMP phosphodiesterase